MANEIVYSSQKTGFESGRRYANPRFFDGRVKQGVTKAIVVGNWPRVVAAYKNAGIEVEHMDAAPRSGGEPAPRPAKAKQPDEAPVEIPDDWRDLSWQERRALASSVSDTPVINSSQAEAAIEAEIERRRG